MNKYNVSISAEAFAAALFAQAGCDVSIQYGANQPEYDILVTKGDHYMKVSAKGSKDGGWLLVKKKSENSYHEAIDLWRGNHKSKKIVYCFVQFKEVKLGEMPRFYLATISEIASHLKTENNGRGHCSLRENHTYKSGAAKGYKEEIPREWEFTLQRMNEILERVG